MTAGDIDSGDFTYYGQIKNTSQSDKHDIVGIKLTKLMDLAGLVLSMHNLKRNADKPRALCLFDHFLVFMETNLQCFLE